MEKDYRETFPFIQIRDVIAIHRHGGKGDAVNQFDPGRIDSGLGATQNHDIQEKAQQEQIGRHKRKLQESR